MIPKLIHYCWFGGNPLPELAHKCIASWKKYLPDYEIKEWNESNFDVYMTKYTEEAYRLKKYAFVSDYARYWILYHYGGLYFDTDVEIIRPLDDIVAQGNFMALEKREEAGTPSFAVAPGLGLGFNPGLDIVKKILNFYQDYHYVSWKGRMTGTVVDFTSSLISSQGVSKNKDGIYQCEDITIYPEDYFCPMNYFTKELNITENTRSIHHYTASWTTQGESFIRKVRNKSLYLYIRLFVSLKHLFK